MELIFKYSRKEAIRDGYLVDVSATAAEAGIKWDTALTKLVWFRCVSIPPEVESCQDESGRLWDILSILRIKLIQMSREECRARSRFELPVRFDIFNSNNEPRQLVELLAVIGPGDNGEPTITLMFPGES